MWAVFISFSRGAVVAVFSIKQGHIFWDLDSTKVSGWYLYLQIPKAISSSVTCITLSFFSEELTVYLLQTKVRVDGLWH